MPFPIPTCRKSEWAARKFRKSALERLPTYVHRMIFEACDSASKQALAQTCQELRNTGWDFRLQNVKVTGAPPSLGVDLAILRDHTQTGIIRTHTTSMHIVITTFSSSDTDRRFSYDYSSEIPDLISCMLSLISKMQRLNCLKITIDCSKQLTAFYENAIHKELKKRPSHPVSYNPLTIQLRGFTSVRVVHFTRMFSGLQHLEVGSNCFKLAPNLGILVNPLPLKSLEIYIQQPDMSGVAALRNINSTFPLLENLIIKEMPSFTWKGRVTSQLRHFIHLRKLEISTDWLYDPDDDWSWELEETMSYECAEACRCLEYISIQINDEYINHWRVERNPDGKFIGLNGL